MPASANTLDLGGTTLIVNDIKTGATKPGGKNATSNVNFSSGLRTKMAINNVNDTTPTAAELTTSFGSPSSVGSGFIGIVKDADTDTNGYLVFSNGTSYYFLKFTKAT
jgi:hypothetical protein